MARFASASLIDMSFAEMDRFEYCVLAFWPCCQCFTITRAGGDCCAAEFRPDLYPLRVDAVDKVGEGRGGCRLAPFAVYLFPAPDWRRAYFSLERSCKIYNWPVRGRPPETVCESLEVLHNRGEVELVACAGEAPQPHAIEAVMGL